jgi:hypothetical protein
MDDEDIMNIFLSIAGPLLAESNLYAQIQGKSKGRGVEGVEKEVSRQIGMLLREGTGTGI